MLARANNGRETLRGRHGVSMIESFFGFFFQSFFFSPRKKNLCFFSTYRARCSTVIDLRCAARWPANSTSFFSFFFRRFFFISSNNVICWKIDPRKKKSKLGPRKIKYVCLATKILFSFFFSRLGLVIFGLCPPPHYQVIFNFFFQLLDSLISKPILVSKFVFFCFQQSNNSLKKNQVFLFTSYNIQKLFFFRPIRDNIFRVNLPVDNFNQRVSKEFCSNLVFLDFFVLLGFLSLAGGGRKKASCCCCSANLSQGKKRLSIDSCFESCLFNWRARDPKS